MVGKVEASDDERLPGGRRKRLNKLRFDQIRVLIDYRRLEFAQQTRDD